MKVIHLFPHTLNLGDYFVKIGIHKLLSEFINDLEYTALPASSKITNNSSNMGGITLETIELLNRHDLIVIGGSNLYETILTDQLEIDIDALQQINRPILLIGIGGGWSSMSPQFPRLSETAREKICLLEEKSCGSSVRDYFTQRLLGAYGMKNSVVTGCPAAYIFEKNLQPVQSGRVYVTGLPYRMYAEPTLNPFISRWRYSYIRRRKVTVGYIKLLQLLDKQGVDFKIFITDTRDIPVAQKLAGNEKIVFDPSPEKLLSHLDERDLMIGYRLHACVPSLSLGIPIIPIPLDGRVQGFVETYGLTEYAVNPYDPSAELLILERIQMALGNERIFWNAVIQNRNVLARVMRNFMQQSLEIFN